MKSEQIEALENVLQELEDQRKALDAKIGSLESLIEIFRTGAKDLSGADYPEREEISKTSLKEWAKENPKFSMQDVMSHFRVSMNTARKYLAEVRKEGAIDLAQERSRGKGVRYTYVVAH